MKNTSTIIIASALFTSVSVMAFPAPDFIKTQMEGKSHSFSNSVFNYGIIPGSSVDATSKIAVDTALGYDLSSPFVDNEYWNASFGGYTIKIEKPSLAKSTTGSVIGFSNAVSTTDTSRVVYNYVTGDIGVITNELAVSLNGTTSPDEVAIKAKLKLKFYFKGIKTAFYVAPEGTDMVSKSNEISKFNGVKSVFIDIMEHEIIPN